MHDTVAVIGAGVIGLAVAVELRKRGAADVVLIDAHDSPGMGSTSRANGGVRAQFSSAVNIAFSQHTITALRELDAATGGRAGYRPIGYLFMTGTVEGASALRRSYELQRSLGVNVTWQSPADVARLAPHVRTAGLRAATLCARDGIIDPHGVAAALFDTARMLGVRHVFSAPVTEMRRHRGRAQLRCGEHVVDAAFVVNAAGPAAADVACMGGVDLPVRPVRSNLACTEAVDAVPETAPMCVDADTGVLVRPEGGGVIIGWTDPEAPSCTDTAFDPRFLDAVAARIGNRFPLLQDVAINPRKCWAGLYPETPDHHAIVDAPPHAPWFVQCAGFGGHGIMHSMAAGRAVAELICDGACTSFDIRPLRLSRFAEGALTVEKAVL